MNRSKRNGTGVDVGATSAPVQSKQIMTNVSDQ